MKMPGQTAVTAEPLPGSIVGPQPQTWTAGVYEVGDLVFWRGQFDGKELRVLQVRPTDDYVYAVPTCGCGGPRWFAPDQLRHSGEPFSY